MGCAATLHTVTFPLSTFMAAFFVKVLEVCIINSSGQLSSLLLHLRATSFDQPYKYS